MFGAEWLDNLAEWLSGRGYAMYEAREGSWGAVVCFRGRSCEIHAVKERGEWWIGLAPLGGDPVMATDVWRYQIDGTEPDPSVPLESLGEQIYFIKERLGEVETASSGDSEIGGRLININKRLLPFEL